MKQFILMSGLAVLGLSASAQDAKPVKRFAPAHFLENPSHISAATPLTVPPKKETGGGQIRNIDAVQIGTASNAFTTLQGESNSVEANDALNTVIFIHRNDASIWGQTNAQYRYAVSHDRGQNFQQNIGPLNPSGTNDPGGPAARYPQATIYNPAGNTNPDNAWMVYLGTWHNGSTSSDTWDGVTHGVISLSNSINTASESNPTINNGNILIASSLVRGMPGEFWTVVNEFSGGTNDSMIVVLRGSWNSAINDVEWGVHTKVNPGYAQTAEGSFFLTPVIAFDPTGQYGWIATAGVTNTDTFQPIFIRSTDGGITWGAPIHVNLANFPSVMNYLHPQGTGVPTTAFDIDLVVDKNGDPHFGVVIGSGSAQSIQSGLSLNMYDITYKTASSQWQAIRLDTVVSFRGAIGSTSTGTDYSTDNRPQLSTSKDGSRVVFLWSDSPINPGDNILPDLIGIAYNVDNGMWTNAVNFTAGSASWNGLATFPSVAHTSFYGNACTNVPVVITRLNQSNMSEDPASFHYFRNIEFCDQYFTNAEPNVGVNNVVKNDINLKVYPNPAANALVVAGLSTGTTQLRVLNVLGETVLVQMHTGNTLARIDVAQLPAGFYTLHATGDGRNSSRTFVIQR